jgi:uncharacterized membrane protein (DUF485 family)
MKKYFLILSLLSVFSIAIIDADSVAASGTTLIPAGESCEQRGDCTPSDFVALFVRGADIITGLAGTMSILMFVYGGFLMITAYGNDAKIKQGRDVIIATVIGIIIILLAWTLVNLVIMSLYGGADNYSAEFQSFTKQSVWYKIIN